MEPYLSDKDGFIILDMVNNVLKNIVLDDDNDIYDVAYILGTYIAYLYATRTQA